ncbi:uncharacterized protein LOC125064737 [Vanessa atalanta]|uniref:uncharacterized protein LOC125064737 n=1 Tax=Vanessa atalanta TaxID=42275 RepID=UPI001FCD4886|nr:uncharacterized protein LOC125064737 [Vanessa atalanta]
MTASSRRPLGELDARACTMLLLLACLFAAAAAAPSYDQRQDGNFNVQTDVQNVVLLIGLPKKLPFGNVLGYFLRNSKTGNDNIQAQDRSDNHVMEAFVEPSTPYRVEIGSEGERSVEGDSGSGRDEEVVIAGRRRLETEPQHQEDEMKLIGATEQCGPERERDPVTLTCRFRDSAPEKTPEVVSSTA